MRLPEWSDPDKRDAALARVAARLYQPDNLTPREVAVVFLLSHGMDYANIAATLCVSQHTVRTHAGHVRAKLNAHTDRHAVATALRLGLIS